VHIESIQLENFKSFRKAQMLDIPKFCVIVGANGSGKSTLFSVFEFLREALDSNVHTAGVRREILRLKSNSVKRKMRLW